MRSSDTGFGAAVGATVDAARLLGRGHQAKLVNAVLRRAQRDGLPAAEPQAHWPVWLRERVLADWGDDAEAVFAASGEQAPLWLRVNRTRVARDDYRARLREAGIDDSVDARLEDESRREALLRALSPLPPRDRKILLMYYGLETGEPMTMEQIATVFGVTRERVRQLRDRALAAVRDGEAAKALRRDWAA